MIRLVYIALLSLSPLMLTAQPFEGGFFAGVSASQVDGDTYSGFDKLGLTGGAYIARDISRNSNWKAELRYIQRGSYKKNTEQDPTLYKLTLHYVEIPLIYQYSVNKKVKPDGGLSPEVYLFHKEENEYGELRAEDYPAFHRFGLGANFGANYYITDRLIAGIRYTYSIIPIREHASGQTYMLNRGQYSNVLSFSFYYHFK